MCRGRPMCRGGLGQCVGAVLCSGEGWGNVLGQGYM